MIAAEEHHEHQAETVDGGEQGAEHAACPQQRAMLRMRQRRQQNRILAVETRGERQCDQRGTADHEAPEGHWQVPAHRPHPEDVLLMVQAENDGARRQEQQGLEEGMGHQVEDGGGPGAHPQRQEHVANLADGGIGQNALDVALGQRRAARHQQGGQADEGHQQLHRGCQFEQHMGARDKVDASRHHRGSVDQGADGRRARHGIGQPGLQGQLRRLAHGAAQQQRCRRHGHTGPRAPLLRRQHQNLLDVQRAQLLEQQEQADGHRSVAHPRNHEGLARRLAIGGIFVPETDKQVTAQAHAFPAQIEQHQIVGQHQHQHGCHKQVHVREEAREAGVVGHVAGGIEMDQGADTGNYQQHHHGQSVHVEREAGHEAAHTHPCPQ